MFEIAEKPSVDALVDRLADEALAEIRRMADDAYRSLGRSQKWINQSRAQRARFDRQRKERTE